MPIWGVDSYSPAHLRAGGTRGATLYDYVCNYLRRNRSRFNEIEAPQFWGRYLSLSRTNASITSAEKDFLLGNGCRILLVYNDTCWDQHHDVDCKREVDRRTIHLGLSGYGNGATSARNACRLAKDTIDAPNGTRIYADLEGWFVSADWIDGWCTEVPDKSRLLGRQYTPGIYGRVLTGSELAYARRTYSRDSWSISLEQAIHEQDRRDQILTRGFRIPSYGPRSRANRHYPQTGAQQNTPAPRPSTPPARSPIRIWSNMPRWSSQCNGVPDSFQGYSTQDGRTRTVVWQYGMNCSNLGRLVDMDLATQEGFDDMWG